MSTQFIIHVAMLGGVFVLPVAAQTDARANMRDVATHDELLQSYRISQENDPIKQLKQVEGPDPAVEHKTAGILDSSDFVVAGKFATLVPKRAILHIPKNLADRLNYKGGVTIQTWPEFFAANRSWITTIEVSRAQAEGKVLLEEETRKQMPRSRNLIVATFKGSPISVLPPQEDASAPPTSEKP